MCWSVSSGLMAKSEWYICISFRLFLTGLYAICRKPKIIPIVFVVYRKGDATLTMLAGTWWFKLASAQE